jgi:hypothetical protein
MLFRMRRFLDRNPTKEKGSDGRYGPGVEHALTCIRDREKYRQIRGADQLAQALEGIALLNAFPHPKFLTCIVSEPRAILPARSTTARGSGTGNLKLSGGQTGRPGSYPECPVLLMRKIVPHREGDCYNGVP